MKWRFNDDRPLFRYAFKAGRHYFRWLFDLEPEDVFQVISLSCSEVPFAGKLLGGRVIKNLKELAEDLGYRRVRRDGRQVWIHTATGFNESFMATTGDLFVTPEKHGCDWRWRNGCRCQLCEKAHSNAKQKDMQRKRLARGKGNADH